MIMERDYGDHTYESQVFASSVEKPKDFLEEAEKEKKELEESYQESKRQAEERKPTPEGIKNDV
jgi:hypothetical protein